MSYIDGEPLHYDTAESQDEAAAAHQMALDVLSRIGSYPDVNEADMRELCHLANIDFNEFKNYSTNSTESTSCLSQPCYSDNLAPEKQPACVI